MYALQLWFIGDLPSACCLEQVSLAALPACLTMAKPTCALVTSQAVCICDAASGVSLHHWVT